MQVIHELAELRQALAHLRAGGRQVGLVPTMGNLHAGHLSLVEQLESSCPVRVTSIFVNPTQFGPNEDYSRYPRTLEADVEALESVGCDLVWAPSVASMYPLPQSFMLSVPETLSDLLCGRSRPGHFDGVASVVLRLLTQVQPDLALFGEKDYQQLLVLQRMAQDLSLPVRIEGAPIVREADGLAMSSRNQYLNADERAIAPTLHAVLSKLAQGLVQGQAFAPLRAQALARLTEAGFRPDYLEWRSVADLRELGSHKADLREDSRLFAAAWLGGARLIDNLALPRA